MDLFTCLLVYFAAFPFWFLAKFEGERGRLSFYFSFFPLLEKGEDMEREGERGLCWWCFGW